MAGTPSQAITTMEAECPPLSHIAGTHVDGTETTQGKGPMAAHIASLCMHKPKDDAENSFSYGPDALVQMATRQACMEASEAASCRSLKVAVTLGRSHSSWQDDAEGDGSSFLMSLTPGFQGIIMGLIGAGHPFIDLNEGVD